MIQNKFDNVYIYSDGGSRGNPGHAAYGFIIYDDQKQIIYKDGKYIEIATNNQAEYQGVVNALKYLCNYYEKNKIKTNIKITIFLDSKLIVEQMNGNYKIKNEGLKPVYWEIRELIIKLGGMVSFIHIPREKNKEADKIVNIAIDKKLGIKIKTPKK